MRNLFLFLMLCLPACNNQQPIKSDQPVVPEAGQIGIYYFRSPLRCETCNAVESIVKRELEGKYAEKVKSGELVFRQFNLDDPGVAEFALRFGVVFKSLIILKEGEQTNLTNEAFLYALSNPGKLEMLLEQTIDQY